MHEFFVTLVLYLYEAYTCFPSLYQVTNIFGAPVNVHSSINFLLIGIVWSLSFVTKWAGSVKDIVRKNNWRQINGLMIVWASHNIKKYILFSCKWGWRTFQAQKTILTCCYSNLSLAYISSIGIADFTWVYACSIWFGVMKTFHDAGISCNLCIVSVRGIQLFAILIPSDKHFRGSLKFTLKS